MRVGLAVKIFEKYSKCPDCEKDITKYEVKDDIVSLWCDCGWEITKNSNGDTLETKILVRPAGQNQWLILDKDQEKIKRNFRAYFNNNNPKQFLEQIKGSDLKIEIYNKMDKEYYDTVTTEGSFGREKIEFKLVRMSEKELMDHKEFNGW